jgi:hypothetical protein
MKTSALILAVLASTGALAESQFEFDSRQYQQNHLNELRRQTRALEDSRWQIDPTPQRGVTVIGGNAYYSRGAAVADALNDLARKIERRANSSCIVISGRVYCEGN